MYGRLKGGPYIHFLVCVCCLTQFEFVGEGVLDYSYQSAGNSKEISKSPAYAINAKRTTNAHTKKKDIRTTDKPLDHLRRRSVGPLDFSQVFHCVENLREVERLHGPLIT